MFTGIIEAIGEVEFVKMDRSNIHFTIRAPFTNELKVDQSIAHDGCCLTVENIEGENYTVTAVKETLDVTNLHEWQAGTLVNLERCMLMNGRLDGHLVQGHVDQTGILKSIQDEDGSRRLTFSYDKRDYAAVRKGSITVNGTSLTVADEKRGEFSVAVIPYTWEHTNFHTLREGDQVNLEFDIIGKYVAKLMQK